MSKPDFLSSELKELEDCLLYRDGSRAEVSKGDVAWHIDHSLKVINGICDALAKSEPEDFHRKVNFKRTMLFLSGKIPRGRVQSPKSVNPPGKIDTGDILRQLEKAHENRINMDKLPKKAHFNHPVLGCLDKKKTKAFLKIHTRHHLQIIRDILKK